MTPGWLHRRLLRRTADVPARLIYARDGEPYLLRYRLLERPGLTIALHQYVVADSSEWLHTHPFPWSLGWPLTGAYLDERVRWFEPTDIHTRRRWIRPWRPNWMPGAVIHRVVTVTGVPGSTWTLFVHGRKRGGWGFLESQGTGLAFYNPFPSGGPRWTHPNGYLARREAVAALRDREPAVDLAFLDDLSLEDHRP